MKLIKSAVISVILILAAAGFTPAEEAELVTIGQADMEKVFSEYQGTKDFQEKIGKMQENLQKAQQEEDREKLMEIQKDFQEGQNQLIRSFQEALENASAPVSKKMNLNIIVAEVLYHSDKVEILDVSDELIKEMN
jgi:Skp family chaperone for outer membrane proteins